MPYQLLVKSDIHYFSIFYMQLDVRG